jgi:hypothetical protein
MSNHRGTVESVRAEIISAIAEVRSVAQAEHDESRQTSADWLDAQFADVTDARGLRGAAADGLSLYGGNGSFSGLPSRITPPLIWLGRCVVGGPGSCGTRRGLVSR